MRGSGDPQLRPQLTLVPLPARQQDAQRAALETRSLVEVDVDPVASAPARRAALEIRSLVDVDPVAIAALEIRSYDPVDVDPVAIAALEIRSYDHS